MILPYFCNAFNSSTAKLKAFLQYSKDIRQCPSPIPTISYTAIPNIISPFLVFIYMNPLLSLKINLFLSLFSADLMNPIHSL